MVGVTNDGGLSHRAYTRQEIGQMTLRDLRLLCSERDPASRHDRPRTEAEIDARRVEKQARADDWGSY